jgi:hypothetical protein
VGLADAFKGSLNRNDVTGGGTRTRMARAIESVPPGLNWPEPRQVLDLATNIPVAGDALSGVLAAYDAAKGDYGSAAMNAAGMLPLVSGMFIGKGAKTWDAVKAADAEKRIARGDDVRGVWKDTGTFKGPDGRLRQEIDDSAAILEHPMPAVVELGKQVRSAKSLEEAKRLGAEYNQFMTWAKDSPAMRAMSVVEHGGDGGLIHPALKQAYPGSASAGGLPRLWWENIGSVKGGEFDEGANRVKIAMGHYAEPDASKSISLHELQHAIQGREGWANGGSPEIFSGKAKTDALKELSEKATRGLDPNSVAAQAARDKLFNDLANDDAFGYEQKLYRRLAGEAEARATQARMNMNAEQRKAVYPLDSYDVPLDQLIIHGAGNGPQMAIDPEAKKRLISDLISGTGSGTYRLGDVTEGQLGGLAKKFNETPLSRDVMMTNGALGHIHKKRVLGQNFTPEEVGSYVDQAMRPKSVVYLDDAKSGQRPALMNEGQFDRVSGRRYDAKMPFYLDGYGNLSVATVFPDGIPKRKAPSK